MSGNVDESLIGHWLESRRRQLAMRSLLERASLEPERFEGWALDLIAEAAPPSARSGRQPRMSLLESAALGSDDR